MGARDPLQMRSLARAGVAAAAALLSGGIWLAVWAHQMVAHGTTQDNEMNMSLGLTWMDSGKFLVLAFLLLIPGILLIGKRAGQLVGAVAHRHERTAKQPRFFFLEEVAIYLNVSVPQVYSLVRSGDLSAVKIGGRGVWRVDRKRLEEYIERLHEDTQRWAADHPLTKTED